MNHLIVVANPNPASFCHAVAERIRRSALAPGSSVEVKDLYVEGFEAVLSSRDLGGFFAGVLPEDVAAAQAQISRADVLHWVYPVWWAGLPAVLKGYVDRVFAPGFAYGRAPDGKGVAPLLAPRKAMLWSPHGNSEDCYTESDMYRSMARVVEGGILEFCGIEVLDRVWFPSIRDSTPAMREGWLDEVEARVAERTSSASA